MKRPYAGGALVVAASLLAACAAPRDDTNGSAIAPLEAADACEDEAEQLLQPVAVFAQPAVRGEAVGLAPGRFVYRCQRQGAWLRVMYPAAGEPVDCTFRNQPHLCSYGWVEGAMETAIFG